MAAVTMLHDRTTIMLCVSLEVLEMKDFPSPSVSLVITSCPRKPFVFLSSLVVEYVLCPSWNFRSQATHAFLPPHNCSPWQKPGVPHGSCCQALEKPDLTMSCSPLAFFHLCHSFSCHLTPWGNMPEGFPGSEHTMAVGGGSGLGGTGLGYSRPLSQDSTKKVGRVVSRGAACLDLWL